MIETFKKYVSNFDMNNEYIKLKCNHSIRVKKLMEKYAKLLNFSDYDISLAGAIGLMHDIGRFKEIENTNKIENIDDSKMTWNILINENLLNKIWSNNEDYDLIEYVIKNHNRLEIEETSDKKKEQFLKLLRDIDKMDIIYLLGYLGELNLKAVKDDLTKEVIESLNKHELIDYKYVNNINDDIATKFAYIYDINYDVCLKEIKENLKYYYEKVEAYDKFKDIYNEVIKYIDERIDKNVR